MDFSDKELKVLLQALYRFRGEVSGASQSEQNKSQLVSSVIGKIETKVGPLTAERTRFDREMDESLAILKTGKMGAAKAAKSKSDLDNEAGSPKVKRSVDEAPAKASAAAAKPRPAKKSASDTPKDRKASGLTKKTGASKTRS
jgi:hypothetical protein